MSFYLTIRGAPDYSRFAVTVLLVEFLAAMPEWRQTGPVTFQAAHGQPWVAITMAACDPMGNYASNGVFLSSVNVVELVCSDSGDPAWYDALAGRIAQFLGWSAFEDLDERITIHIDPRSVWACRLDSNRHLQAQYPWSFSLKRANKWSLPIT